MQGKQLGGKQSVCGGAGRCSVWSTAGTTVRCTQVPRLIRCSTVDHPDYAAKKFLSKLSGISDLLAHKPVQPRLVQFFNKNCKIVQQLILCAADFAGQRVAMKAPLRLLGFVRWRHNKLRANLAGLFLGGWESGVGYQVITCRLQVLAGSGAVLGCHASHPPGIHRPGLPVADPCKPSNSVPKATPKRRSVLVNATTSPRFAVQI